MAISTATALGNRRIAEEAARAASPLLTIREACAYLKISRASLYEQLPRLDVVKLGAKTFIGRDSCDHYIDVNTKRGDPKAKPNRKAAA